jgi:hypothetical protein
MNAASAEPCTTCHGAGEVGTDHGPRACPDCFGEGRCLGSFERVEWRLREIERAHRDGTHGCEPDLRWLVLELRRSRRALLTILTRCQDEDCASALADEIKFVANQALEIYEPVSG